MPPGWVFATTTLATLLADTGVRACYDEGKRVAETLFFDFHRQHDIAVRVARIFNTFGPGMHPYGEA